MFLEGYIAPDMDSAEFLHGMADICQFFAFKNFLTYRPKKKVWADWPTIERVRVNRVRDKKSYFLHNKGTSFGHHR